MTQEEILDAFTAGGALKKGHFLLRSGLHSDAYFQAAAVLEFPKTAELLCRELASRFAPDPPETVIAPALGGILVGYEVARALGVRSIFAEKDAESNLVLRRGFRIRPGERVLVAEDVVTRGGRVQQTLDVVARAGGKVVGVAVLVDRSGGRVDFGVRFESLARLNLKTFSPDQCPLCAQGVPIDKPGSK